MNFGGGCLYVYGGAAILFYICCTADMGKIDGEDSLIEYIKGFFRFHLYMGIFGLFCFVLGYGLFKLIGGL